MNSSGKVLTIFLVIIAILLISLTAISLFFFQKETNRRKLAEASLQEFQSEKVKLEEALTETKKQNFLLQEKSKEADARIDDLSDELELEKGLREEMKIESAALKTQLEEVQASKETLAQKIKEKEDLQKKLSADLTVSEQKIRALETKLKEEMRQGQKLGKLYEDQQDEISRGEKARASKNMMSREAEEILDEDADEDIVSMDGVELGEIIVVPGEGAARERDAGVRMKAPLEETVGALDKVIEGRILSVDNEIEFVIVSLGETDGIEVGNVLSVYRGENYVGDIRVTRLQPEMSAADLIPPFSIRSVKKNDLVKVK